MMTVMEENLINYGIMIGIFLIGAASVYAISDHLIRWSFVLGWLDRPNKRKIHEKSTPNTGGVAILLGFVMAVIGLYLSPINYDNHLDYIILPILVGAILISIVGFIDDRINLSPIIRLALNGLISAFTIYMTNKNSYNFSELSGILIFVIHIFWYLFLINAFNLIDGIDGLSVSTAFLSMIAVVAIQLQIEPANNIIPLQIIAAAVMFGFIPWNLPKAKIFLGDVGSTLLGFLLAALTSIPSTRSSMMPAMILPLLCVAYPLFDVMLVSYKRIAQGLHPFSGDRSHLHHRLNRITGSPVKSFLLIIAVHGLTCFQAILIAPFMILSTWRIILITVINFSTFVFFLLMYEKNMRKEILGLHSNIKNLFSKQKNRDFNTRDHEASRGYKECRIDLSPMLDAIAFEEKDRAQTLLSSVEELIRSNTRDRDLVFKSQIPGSFVMMLPNNKTLNLELFKSRLSDVLDWFFQKYNVKGPHQKLYKIKINHLEAKSNIQNTNLN